jgi:hypothetical protein
MSLSGIEVHGFTPAKKEPPKAAAFTLPKGGSFIKM